MVNLALESVNESSEKESLLALQNDLMQLIQLTQESLVALSNKTNDETTETPQQPNKTEMDDEYALFMVRWNLLTYLFFLI